MTEHDVARFDVQAFAVAKERALSAPLALTDRDLDQLRIISATLAEDAFARRKAAQLTIVAGTKSTPVATADELLASVGSFDELCKRFPDHPMTLRTFQPFLKFVDDLKAQNAERATRIATLEERVRQLSDRLVELEAERAIAKGDA